MVKFFPIPLNTKIESIHKIDEKKIEDANFENYLKAYENNNCSNDRQPWHSLWNEMEKYKYKYQANEPTDPDIGTSHLLG